MRDNMRHSDQGNDEKHIHLPHLRMPHSLHFPSLHHHHDGHGSAKEEVHQDGHGSAKEEVHQDGHGSAKEEVHQDGHGSAKEEVHHDGHGSAKEEVHQDGHGSSKEEVHHHDSHGSSTEEAHDFHKDVPKGCVAVYVGTEGEERQRFVVPAVHINHPLFQKLLKEAEKEYGFEQKGAITIPCNVSDFQSVQDLINEEHHQSQSSTFCFR